MTTFDDRLADKVAIREGLIDKLDDENCETCFWFARGDNALWVDPRSWSAFLELENLREHIDEHDV